LYYTGDKLTSFNQVKVVKDVALDKHWGGTIALQYNFDGSVLVAGFYAGGIRVRSHSHHHLTSDNIVGVVTTVISRCHVVMS
jgi:hypothetical protein